MSLKWPKSTLCEIRAAWSGVFWVPGGTTGPGFKAEKWTPHSRRRILTQFCISHFLKLTILCILVISHLCKIDHFLQSDYFLPLSTTCNKALWWLQGGEWELCVVVLPSLSYEYVCGSCMYLKLSGRLHKVECFSYSRSPLCCFLRCWVFLIWFLNVGEITQGRIRYYTLVLPSYKRCIYCGFCQF